MLSYVSAELSNPECWNMLHVMFYKTNLFLPLRKEVHILIGSIQKLPL